MLTQSAACRARRWWYQVDHHYDDNTKTARAAEHWLQVLYIEMPAPVLDKDLWLTVGHLVYTTAKQARLVFHLCS